MTNLGFDISAMPHGYTACLRRIAEAPAERPFVVAQLGQSLDGRIALPSGESRWINNSAALDHLHRLRAVTDAVVVGVGTAIADDPMLNVRRVTGRNPARVVIDAKGRLPRTAKLLDGADGAERIVVTTPGTLVPDGVSRIELPTDGNGFAPHAIVAALAGRGLRRILVEGGAQTVSSFIDAGVVDRLHVLVAPILLGSGKTGLSLVPVARMTEALRPPTEVHVLDDGDVLFDCNLRALTGVPRHAAS